MFAAALGIGLGWSDSVEPVAPKVGQIYGWGRQAPTVRLEARVILSQPAERVFVSAIIADAQGNTVDRVALYDDGTHGDAQAGDLLFTELYTPRSEGILQVRFKAESERDGKRFSRFSKPYHFEVVRAPYARFVNKLAAERPRVGPTTNTEIVLLIGDEERYNGSLDAIALQASCTPNGTVEIPQKLAPQTTIRYRFEKPGEHQLRVQAVMTYKGQTIATEPDTLTVVYNTPSAWLLWAGIGVILLGLFVLPGKRVPVYEHEFQLVNPTYGTRNTHLLSAHEPPLELEGGSLVLEYVKGSPQVKLAQGTLTTPSGETLEAGALLIPGEQYRTPSGHTIHFRETIPQGETAVAWRCVPNTLWKLLALVIGIALVVYYFFLGYQLAQLTNL
jgi:hypothetical protein